MNSLSASSPPEGTGPQGASPSIRERSLPCSVGHFIPKGTQEPKAGCSGLFLEDLAPLVPRHLFAS